MRTPLAIAATAAALTLTACTTPTTPQTVDRGICNTLTYILKDTPGPARDIDPNKLLAWIHDDIQDADGTQPTDPIADAIGMIERTADMPPEVWIIGVDTLASRCIEAGHIEI